MIRQRREERGLPPRESSKKIIKKASFVANSLPSEGLKHQDESHNTHHLHRIKQEMTTNSSRALLINDTSRTHLSKRLEREADKIDSMMKDLTDYV
jgi:hypothetical protein